MKREERNGKAPAGEAGRKPVREAVTEAATEAAGEAVGESVIGFIFWTDARTGRS